MSRIETNQRFANSFASLRLCGDNHKYLTKSKTKGLLDITFTNTQIYGTQSTKYICNKGLEQLQKQFFTFTFKMFLVPEE